jgi:hypothetical protein
MLSPKYCMKQDIWAHTTTRVHDVLYSWIMTDEVVDSKYRGRGPRCQENRALLSALPFANPRRIAEKTPVVAGASPRDTSPVENEPKP